MANIQHKHTIETTAAAAAAAVPSSAAACSSSSSSVGRAPAEPPPRMVEIEKKVRIHADTEKILQQLGFREHEQPVRIVDLYVDDEAATLTRSNYWLRRRDQGWELKLPASVSGVALASQSGGMTRYEEITDDAAITAALEALFERSARLELTAEESAELRTPVADLHCSAADEAGWPKLMEIIRRRKLIPITHLCTTRRTLQWDAAATPASSSHPYSLFTVVLDAADYFRDPPALPPMHPDVALSSLRTFSVAEVEIVLTNPSEAQMKEAEQRVEQFAKHIEAPKETPSSAASSAFSPLPKGKIERYLALFRPAHYRLLTTRRK